MHLLAALCCSKRHNSGFSILLKDTSACRFFGKTGDCTADLQVGGRPLAFVTVHIFPEELTLDADTQKVPIMYIDAQDFQSTQQVNSPAATLDYLSFGIAIKNQGISQIFCQKWLWWPHQQPHTEPQEHVITFLSSVFFQHKLNINIHTNN